LLDPEPLESKQCLEEDYGHVADVDSGKVKVKSTPRLAACGAGRTCTRHWSLTR
jgi:hypothetical protein